MSSLHAIWWNPKADNSKAWMNAPLAPATTGRIESISADEYQKDSARCYEQVDHALQELSRSSAFLENIPVLHTRVAMMRTAACHMKSCLQRDLQWMADQEVYPKTDFRIKVGSGWGFDSYSDAPMIRAPYIFWEWQWFDEENAIKGWAKHCHMLTEDSFNHAKNRNLPTSNGSFSAGCRWATPLSEADSDEWRDALHHTVIPDMKGQMLAFMSGAETWKHLERLLTRKQNALLNELGEAIGETVQHDPALNLGTYESPHPDCKPTGVEWRLEHKEFLGRSFERDTLKWTATLVTEDKEKLYQTHTGSITLPDKHRKFTSGLRRIFGGQKPNHHVEQESDEVSSIAESSISHEGPPSTIGGSTLVGNDDDDARTLHAASPASSRAASLAPSRASSIFSNWSGHTRS